MALTTTVDSTDVAVSLGRSAPSRGSIEDLQWVMWIGDALRFIQHRVDALAVVEASIDQTDLNYVIREAVVAQVRKPDDWTQGGEDPTSPKWYRTGAGRVVILEEWWTLLGLSSTSGRAFNVDMMPPGAGIGGDGVTYWWWS